MTTPTRPACLELVLALLGDPEAARLRSYIEALEARAALAQPEPEASQISDGYHTFAELYEHRYALCLALMRSMPQCWWFSQCHADGEPCFGGNDWFIVGADLPGLDDPSITYHLPMRLWNAAQATGARELPQGRPWDGHSANDVVDRLMCWTALAQPEPEAVGPTDTSAEEWQWYTYCPEEGIELYPNRQQAQSAAQSIMGSYEVAAHSDGWHEDMELVSWGMLVPVEHAQVVERRPADPGGEFDEWVRYELRAVARWGRPAPAPAGEVAELVAWLGVVSEQFRLAELDPEADQTDRAADLLERQAAPVPVAVSQRLPEPNVKVLAHYLNDLGKGRTICGIWVPAKTRSDSYGDDDFTEYDEASDTFYWPEGWYEAIENWDDLGYVKVDEGEVIYWQPLPQWPAQALPLPSGEVEP